MSKCYIRSQKGSIISLVAKSFPSSLSLSLSVSYSLSLSLFLSLSLTLSIFLSFPSGTDAAADHEPRDLGHNQVLRAAAAAAAAAARGASG
jgi:hypothetical protein